MILLHFLMAIGNSPEGAEQELQLLRRIRRRDQQALEEFYELYKGLLFGIIRSVIKDREEAEDLLQEVFVRIWEKAYSFDVSRGNVYSWVVTLARNRAIDRIRSKGYKTREKQSQVLDNEEGGWTLEGDSRDPLQSTIHADRAEAVKQALQEIPEEQRRVIEIAYYRGYTQSEIAGELDLPLGTVKTRIRLGMMKLKDLLEDTIQHHG